MNVLDQLNCYLKGFNEDVFLTWAKEISNGDRLKSVVHFCAQHKGAAPAWQQGVKSLERQLMRRYTVDKVVLRRGSGHACDQNCSFRPCKVPRSVPLGTRLDAHAIGLLLKK